MHTVAVVVGAVVVLAVLADLVNTLVTTTTTRGRWWFSWIYYRVVWRVFRVVAGITDDPVARNRLLGVMGPASVLGLLAVWVIQQVVGFALIWWGLGGVRGVSDLADALYFSGVTYFTLGFGDVVPTEDAVRLVSLAEAFCGVLTTALMIGYLPALYGAYAERERKLTTLDDGTESRITPTSLVVSRTPSGDPAEMFSFFEAWEDWIAGVLESHTTFPMLALFRSKHAGQSWITALGLVTDSALHLQMVRGADNRAPYWMMRRATRLLQELTEDVDLSAYEAARENNDPAMFSELHATMAAHGFDVLPIDEALERSRYLRSAYSPALEYMIDHLAAPRGFWGHEIGRVVDQSENPAV